jgi:predicted molibdopterin-dependent oxidoreductase YjgC
MTNAIPEIDDASCVLVVGLNTTEAHPLVAHRVYRAKLKGAKLIVVDPRRIQLSSVADIHVTLNFGSDVAFINGMMHAILKNNWHNSDFVSERTFSNTERKMQRVRKAVEPLDGTLPDWKILCELGCRLGLSMDYAFPEEIFAEMVSLSPMYGGISYERLESVGIQWPCPSADHPGTPFLHQGKFTRGRGLFSVIDYRPPEEMPDDEYPYLLTTGRLYAHYHTRTQTGNCPSLHKEFPEPFAQISYSDAEKLGLKDGDIARVTSRRGQVFTPVRPGDIVPPGAIFMDFHFAEANPNELLGTSLDPISKTPDYKVCAVKIEAFNDKE